MRPDQEKTEDQLLDALLHEQNRNDREQAYADIENAIDNAKIPSPIIVRSMWPQRLGLVAACVALGGLAVLWMNTSRKNVPKIAILEPQKSPQQERAELEIAIREMEDNVEESRKVLSTISRSKNIGYYGEKENTNEGAAYAIQEFNRLDGERFQLETQIEGLAKYEGEQLLIYASGLDLPDNIIRTLYPQYLELRRQIDGLKASGLGDNHPTLKTNVKVFDSMTKDLGEGIQNLRTRLQGQLETTKERLAIKENERNKGNLAKLYNLERSIDAQDYLDAKQNFETDQGLLKRMKLKLRDYGGVAAVKEPGMRKEMPEKPSAPSTSVSKQISTAPASSQMPLPETAVNTAPTYFGRDENFGDGWGTAGDKDKGGAFIIPRARRVPPPGEPANTERYSPLADPTWQRPVENPLSTFSIDVDTASYANIRRMIREGRNIPADAVRIEECINAFKFNYEPPAGDKAFAVHTELATCPWNENNLLVKFGIKGREIAPEKRPVSNLVFLIDVSGSMQSRDKLPLVKESLKLLLHQLDERDSVSYVVYAGREGVVLPPTKMTESGLVQALQALEKLESGGSTNGGAGIKRAYQLAMENFIVGGVNRVILASDGDFNVGVTGNDALVKLVKERASKNIYLSALAYGTGNLNDAMFEAISNEGNGNYFYIDGIRESRKVFLENLTGSLITIAKDVKIQVEFNPAKVGSYRLIGYANRVLKDEDFNNDKIDAGDIGAGHTVTAFYEIVPAGAPQPNGGGVDTLKYQEAAPQVKPPVVSSDEWLTLKLRHKHPEGDISALQEAVVKGEATPWQETGSDFQFATAVAMFGMKLRRMDDVSAIPWESVRRLARAGFEDDKNESRAEFVELIGELEKR